MYSNAVGFSDLAKAFIALALIVVMVDLITRSLETIMKKIDSLPNQFEEPLAYLILTILSTIVCWQGHFDLFSLLGFTWAYPCEGWLITGAVMAGGSSLVGKQFSMVGLIPNMISGVATTLGIGTWVTRTVGSSEDTDSSENKENGESKPCVEDGSGSA